MKHTFFTLTLFLLALLSTSCGNKKVAYQNPLPMAFGDPFLLKASDGKYYMYGTGGVSNGFKVNAERKSKVDDNTAKMQSIKWLGV